MASVGRHVCSQHCGRKRWPGCAAGCFAEHIYIWLVLCQWFCSQKLSSTHLRISLPSAVETVRKQPLASMVQVGWGRNACMCSVCYPQRVLQAQRLRRPRASQTMRTYLHRSSMIVNTMTPDWTRFSIQSTSLQDTLKGGAKKPELAKCFSCT